MRYSTVAWLMLTTSLATAAGTIYGIDSFQARSSASIPQDQLDPIVLVGEIRALAHLETATVPMQTLVRGSRGEGIMRALAGEELLFQAVGEAHAGVDLGKLGPEDVWSDGEGSVWVRLPAAEIFSVVLDVDRSQVVARDRGLFGSSNLHFETDARRAAQRQLEAQATEIGLEDAAAEQARVVVSDLLGALGARAVRFVGVDPGFIDSEV